MYNLVHGESCQATAQHNLKLAQRLRDASQLEENVYMHTLCFSCSLAHNPSPSVQMLFLLFDEVT